MKTIKNVDEITWQILNMLAKKKKVKIATLLCYMASEYEKLELAGLKQFVPEKPIISAKEAEELEKAVKGLRKGYGFRH